MNTTISSSIAVNLNANVFTSPVKVSAFGSGFRSFLESSEVYAESTDSRDPASIEQPSQFLDSVKPWDAGEEAWQSFTDTVRERLCNSLGNALLLAMQPTRRAPELALAVSALRKA